MELSVSSSSFSTFAAGVSLLFRRGSKCACFGGNTKFCTNQSPSEFKRLPTTARPYCFTNSEKSSGSMIRFLTPFVSTTRHLSQPLIDPLLHLVAPDMQGFRQAVDGKPVATSLRILAQAMQHRTNGVWRALHDPGNFFDGAAFDEIKEPLLFGLCPGSPHALLCYTMLT
jgi:hypothetical protein